MYCYLRCGAAYCEFLLKVSAPATVLRNQVASAVGYLFRALLHVLSLFLRHFAVHPVSYAGFHIVQSSEYHKYLRGDCYLYHFNVESVMR